MSVLKGPWIHALPPSVEKGSEMSKIGINLACMHAVGLTVSVWIGFGRDAGLVAAFAAMFVFVAVNEIVMAIRFGRK